MTRRHHLLLLPSIFLLLCSLAPSDAHCIARHRDALLRLIHNVSLSWSPAEDCCRWRGVTCDGATGEVTGLDLSGRFLGGMVNPRALFNLTSLTSLDLSFNNLNFTEVQQASGTPGFEALGRLTALNLSYSGFAGQIPLGVASLTGLVSLDFSIQFLPGSVYLKYPDFKTLIRNLSRLEVLYLDGVYIWALWGDCWNALSQSAPKIRKLSFIDCNITGGVLANSSPPVLESLTDLRLDRNRLSMKVPAFVGDLCALRVLSLRETGLVGPLPEEISHLRNLTTLDASGNPLLDGRLPESIGDMRSLEVLQLSNCRLNGSIAASVGKLTRLVKLDLSNNILGGELPPFDGNWSSLAEILLGNNNLIGSIPSSYGKLLKLAVLDLESNRLAGQIPLSLFSLPSLKTLDLHENMLSGTLEELTSASSPLETIDLSSNNLQGAVPHSVFGLSSLKILTLAYNNFSGNVDLNLLQSMLNLSSLDLSYNSLHVTNTGVSSILPNISNLRLASCGIGQFPTFLKYQLKLNYLDLSANRIAGNIPQWVWSVGGNPKLSHLNLSYNMLTGFEEPLPDLLNSTLRVIDLHNNSLVAAILHPPASSSFVDYSNNNLSYVIPSNIYLYLNFTIFFSVSNNRLFGSIPPSICNASFLQVLDLSLNNLSSLIPPCLAQMEQLRVLNLRGNSFGDSVPSNFSTACNLRTLNLNKNLLQGALPVSLSNCTMLEVLDVGNNHLSGEFPLWLGDLTGLRVLVLRSNKFYGTVKAINSSKDSFSMLQIMDLSSNEFNGSLSPDHFTKLTAMMPSDDNSSQPAVQFKYLQGLYYQDSVTITSKGQEMTLVKILTIYTSIDFSCNSFEGSIPDEIGKLIALKVLNMSHNSLTGTIPSALGQLRQLESLDLSQNKLSGQIPNELTKLTFLSSLNLSYNNLCGKIPEGVQFHTFTNASFLGNPCLCGVPLPNCPSPNNSSPAVDVKASYHAYQPNWVYIFTGLGLGGGLALVVGPLLIYQKWRKLVNYHVDEILLAIFPSSFWECVSCGDDKIDAEEKTEEGSDWVDEGPQRFFCVFCTELEFKFGRVVIGHRECSCNKVYM